MGTLEDYGKSKYFIGVDWASGGVMDTTVYSIVCPGPKSMEKIFPYESWLDISERLWRERAGLFPKAKTHVWGPQSWPCSYCTGLNESARYICQHCSAPRR